MRLARTVHGLYGLLHAVGTDFTTTIGLTEERKGLNGMIMSFLFMSHLTLLYCYMATPVVWAINPQQFVFHEMLLGAAFLAAMTGIMLTVNPIQNPQVHAFRKTSSALSLFRFVSAFAIAAALLALLFVLVELSTQAIIQLGQ